MLTQPKSMLNALAHVPEKGKAELVNGEIVCMSPTGGLPARAGGAIYFSLRLHERLHGGGRAFPDNVGFVVDLPNRESFSPDAAFFTGALVGMSFPRGAPIFAAEVRSEFDYGPAMERELANKRADYFAAGTLVVWDIDLLGVNVVRKYSALDPANPTIFRAGQIADAEPAVPGWKMPVDELFE